MKLPKYNNAEVDKAKILKENKHKSGIYIWKNKINGKRYIGSAVDLSKRLKFYYSNSSMEALLKKSKSLICSAILKHGCYNFSLEILEYCEPEKCLEREDYYLKKLKPEYNISLNPTAPFSGRNHSEETKTIISEARKGTTHNEETKTKISDTMVGNTNKKGQPKTEGSGKLSQAIEVTDIKNNTTTSYDSIGEAARALNCNESSIRSNLKSNSNKPYKNIYMFTYKK